jgi:hypothetical protein
MRDEGEMPLEEAKRERGEGGADGEWSVVSGEREK